MHRHLLLGLALLAAPALADVRAGVEAWGRGDYRQAVEEWRGPAVAGDADAQFNLGQAYKLGRGVPVDPALAEGWFRKAAVQGHEQAGDNYALALFGNDRKADAVPWLEKSVARDEPRAELVYGTMLFNGDGVPRDYARAYALMTRAAAPRPGTDGLPSARETLGEMDAYIAAADRQRGVALAQQIALAAASRPAPTGMGGGAGARVTEQLPRPAPVQTVDLPPSRVPTPAPAKTPRGKTAKPVAAAPKPTPTPVVARPAPVATKAVPAASPRGGWKVQLGAFRNSGNAEALWTRVRGRLGGSPLYVAGGGLTRLQATGFASRAAAQAACARAGMPCAPIAP